MDSKNHTLVSDVADEFYQQMESTSADLRPGTILNRTGIVGHFVVWCADEKIRYAEDLTRVILRKFADSWGYAYQGHREKGLSQATQTNYYTVMRMFSRFFEGRGEGRTDFAAKLRREGKLRKENKEKAISDVDFAEILRQALIVTADRPADVSALRTTAFLNVMRQAGMAITDATLLSKDKIIGGDEVQYRRVKTERGNENVLVKVPLPDYVLDQLNLLEKTEGLYHGKYYFARNATTLPLVGSTWRRYLTPIFKAAGLSGCKSHGLRHAFCEEMLLKDNGTTPLEHVRGWMGHKTIMTILKDYHATLEKRDALASAYRRRMLEKEKAAKKAAEEAAARLAKKASIN